MQFMPSVYATAATRSRIPAIKRIQLLPAILPGRGFKKHVQSIPTGALSVPSANKAVTLWLWAIQLWTGLHSPVSLPGSIRRKTLPRRACSPAHCHNSGTGKATQGWARRRPGSRLSLGGSGLGELRFSKQARWFSHRSIRVRLE